MDYELLLPGMFAMCIYFSTYLFLRTYNNTKGLWQALSRGDCNSIADHTSLESALGSFFLTGTIFFNYSRPSYTTYTHIGYVLLLIFIGNEQPRLDVLEMYINRMEILKEWMEKQTSFRFYSSSLLFVYDGTFFD